MEYKRLADLYKALEATSKRFEKTWLISTFLKSVPKEDIKAVIYLIQGNVFPQYDERKIGMSSKLLIKAIAHASGESEQNIEKFLALEGDLGLVAERLFSKKKQQTLLHKKLTTKKVFENLRNLAEISGEGTVSKKTSILSELLNSASPEEAKYIIRTVNETLRAGVGDGTLRDALVWAFFPKVRGIFFKCKHCNEYNPQTDKCLSCREEITAKFEKEIEEGHKHIAKAKSITELKKIKEDIVPTSEKEARRVYSGFIQSVQSAFDLTSDLGIIAELLLEYGPNGLEKIEFQAGKPLKVMLYQKAENIRDGFEQVGKPAILEPKFDGFRMQIHKFNDKGKDKIALFTRRLENVTSQFPDVEESARSSIKIKSCIIDSEVVGISFTPSKEIKFVPFQNISQRIKRKYHIEKLVKELPIIVMAFDILEADKKSMINEPFIQRRKKLVSVINEIPQRFEIVKQLITADENEAQSFYEKCLREGHEGIMMKNPNSIYKPGSRVGYGVKIKPVMETLDLIVTAAEWGEGKRAKWFSSFTVACAKKSEKGKPEILDIGQVGTGIKEKESEDDKSKDYVTFEELTKALKPLIIEQKGKDVKVRPSIVIEVSYQEIQKSPTYSSGYALRFPRLVKVRWDRGIDDISNLSEVEKLYRKQKR